MVLLFIVLYLVIGAVLLVLLAGFEGPTVTAAFRRDLRTLRRRGPLALISGGPIWVATAVAAWPLVAACELISWRERVAFLGR